MSFLVPLAGYGVYQGGKAAGLWSQRGQWGGGTPFRQPTGHSPYEGAPIRSRPPTARDLVSGRGKGRIMSARGGSKRIARTAASTLWGPLGGYAVDLFMARGPVKQRRRRRRRARK